MEAARQAEEQIFETPDVEDHEATKLEGEELLRAHPYQEQFTDQENISGTRLDPDGAFEVFHGKRFETVPSGGRRRGRPDEGVVGIEGTKDKAVEGPMERYLRLKSEISELSEDLAALAGLGEKEGQSSGAPQTGDDSPSNIWSHLAEETRGLRQELHTLATTPETAYQLGLELGGGDATTTIRSDVTEELVKRVATLGGNKKAQEMTSQDLAGTGGASMVYELYYNPSRALVKAATLNALEARIAAMERAVVRTATGDDTLLADSAMAAVLTSKNVSITDAVLKMEKQVSLLENTSVEVLRQRLQLLKGEWEDVKRERGKQAQTIEAYSNAHARRVEQLYNQLQSLEGVASDLPTLVSRLQVLQELHSQGLLFSRRLQELETGQDMMKSLVTNATDSLNKVEDSLKANMAQMLDNIKMVDQRIDELRDRTKK